MAAASPASRAWPQGAERHPIQQAFIDCHGLQCGFCTPGMMMSAAALLQHTPNPSRGADRTRAGGQPVPLHRLRQHRRRGQAGRSDAGFRSHEMSAIAQRFGSGQSVRRIEDPALVAGKGQFTDDVALPGQTFLSLQRSPYPHARIVSVDPLGRAGTARRVGGLHRRRSGALPASSRWPRSRCSPAPTVARRRRRRATRWRWTTCASSAKPWSRWSAPTRRCRASRRATRWPSTTTSCPTSCDLDDALAAGAPKCVGRRGRQHRRRDAPRRAPRPATRPSPGGACGGAGPRQPAAGADARWSRARARRVTKAAALTLRISSQMPGGVRDALCNEASRLADRKACA